MSDRYAENRRRNANANAEWAARQPFGDFTTDPALADWADSIVSGTSVAELPLDVRTTPAWYAALGLPADDWPYIGNVLDALAEAARRDHMLVPPEPGVVGIAFASRDPVSEEETELGWGFRPDRAKDLKIIARHALPLAELAGSPRDVGGRAVATAIRNAASTLNDPRQGMNEALQFVRAGTPVPPTRWTRGCGAPSTSLP